jgi:hypothetical protein
MFSLCIPTMDRFDKFLSINLVKYLDNEYRKLCNKYLIDNLNLNNEENTMSSCDVIYFNTLFEQLDLHIVSNLVYDVLHEGSTFTQ